MTFSSGFDFRPCIVILEDDTFFIHQSRACLVFCTFCTLKLLTVKVCRDHFYRIHFLSWTKPVMFHQMQDKICRWSFSGTVCLTKGNLWPFVFFFFYLYNAIPIIIVCCKKKMFFNFWLTRLSQMFDYFVNSLVRVNVEVRSEVFSNLFAMFFCFFCPVQHNALCLVTKILVLWWEDAFKSHCSKWLVFKEHGLSLSLFELVISSLLCINSVTAPIQTAVLYYCLYDMHRVFTSKHDIH